MLTLWTWGVASQQWVTPAVARATRARLKVVDDDLFGARPIRRIGDAHVPRTRTEVTSAGGPGGALSVEAAT